MLSLKEEWKVLPPYKSIKLLNGKIVTLNVVLVTSDSHKISANIYGSARNLSGMKLNVRFEPEIPKKTKIKAIELTANNKLTCNSIIWHNFNSK